MSEKNGVCVIIPQDQDGFRPQVFGMGLLVNPREIVTCAHVIDVTLGSDWLRSLAPAVVKVCFPFTKGHACVRGVVDRTRYFPPGRSKAGEPSDVAVIELTEDAPVSVQTALLRDPVIGVNAKVYGFRGKTINGKWRSHSYGEWAEGKVVGPQPGGRVQFDGLRLTGARVQRGFSGGAVYDVKHDAVVGMIAQSDREKESKIAQFIDANALRIALGIESNVPVDDQPVGPKAALNSSKAKQLIVAANEASEPARRAWLGFVTLLVLLLGTVATVSHADLFLNGEVDLAVPIINVQIPLSYAQFFTWAPAILLAAYLFLLIQHGLLANKYRKFIEVIEPYERHSEREHPARELVHSHWVSQILAGPTTTVTMAFLMQAAVLLTFVLLPIVTLVFFQIKFLPYHDSNITFWHRFSILAGIGMLFLLVPIIHTKINNINDQEIKIGDAWRVKPLSLICGLICAVSIVGFSLLIVTFPGEKIHRNYFGTYKWIKGENEISWAPRNTTVAYLISLHEWLFSRNIDGTRAGIFSDTLLVRNLESTSKLHSYLSNNLRYRDFRGADLAGINLTKADFRGVNLAGANLSGAKLDDANFSCDTSDTEPPRLKDPWPDRCSWLNGADLSGATARGTMFEGARLHGADFREADLRGADLSKAHLDGAYFNKAKMQAAYLYRSDLTAANFEEAHLEGASLKEATLLLANFQRSWLWGANFRHASFGGNYFAQAKVWRNIDGPRSNEFAQLGSVKDGDPKFGGPFVKWRDSVIESIPLSSRAKARARLEILNPLKPFDDDRWNKYWETKSHPEFYKISDSIRVNAICGSKTKENTQTNVALSELNNRMITQPVAKEIVNRIYDGKKCKNMLYWRVMNMLKSQGKLGNSLFDEQRR